MSREISKGNGEPMCMRYETVGISRMQRIENVTHGSRKSVRMRERRGTKGTGMKGAKLRDAINEFMYETRRGKNRERVSRCFFNRFRFFRLREA